MYRKQNLIFLLAIAIFSCRSTENDEAGKEKLKTILASYYDAMTKKDTATMQSLTSANFVLFSEGMIYNNQTAASTIPNLPSFSARFKFDSINVYMSEGNASAYYLKEAVFIIEGREYPPARFLESATFNRENNEWKLRFLHSTMRK